MFNIFSEIFHALFENSLSPPGPSLQPRPLAPPLPSKPIRRHSTASAVLAGYPSPTQISTRKPTCRSSLIGNQFLAHRSERTGGGSPARTPTADSSSEFEPQPTHVHWKEKLFISFLGVIHRKRGF